MTRGNKGYRLGTRTFSPLILALQTVLQMPVALLVALIAICSVQGSVIEYVAVGESIEATHHALVSLDGVMWHINELPSGWNQTGKGGYNAASNGNGTWMLVGQQGVYRGIDNFNGTDMSWTFLSNTGFSDTDSYISGIAHSPDSDCWTICGANAPQKTYAVTTDDGLTWQDRLGSEYGARCSAVMYNSIVSLSQSSMSLKALFTILC